MALFKEYEKKTNVHIVWEEMASNDLTAINQKLTLQFESGNMPDCYILTGAFPDSQMLSYGEIGAILPISDYWKCVPNLKKILDAYPSVKKSMTTAEGKIYGAPQLRVTDSENHDRYTYKIEINKKWMNTLGLAVPKTISELKTVLRAFRDNDPNGNGIKDEIPLTMYGFVPAFFTTPFGEPAWTSSQHNMFVNNQGKIVYGPASESYKKGLTLMDSLLDEKLLDLDFQGQSESGYKTKVASGRVGMVVTYAILLDAPNNLKDYMMIPPIVENTGIKQTWIYDVSGMYTPASYIITSKCKNPTLAARWIDWFYSDDGAMSVIYGPQGTMWDKSIDGKYVRLGTVNMPASVPDQQTWQGMLTPHIGMTYGFSDELAAKVVDSAGMAKELAVYTKFVTETRTTYSSFKPKNVFPYMMFSQKASDTINELQSDIYDYQVGFLLQVIAQEANVSAEWDNYITQLKKLGLDEYVGLYQTRYDQIK